MLLEEGRYERVCIFSLLARVWGSMEDIVAVIADGGKIMEGWWMVAKSMGAST